ncbi:MAG: hypothetical protein Q8S33_18690 [Myxococcales bacterium]|nr:hypothetical protein [Myxococcales bacterium]MDP3502370.1 hypothetical protein [Myxococcales bacterium]
MFSALAAVVGYFVLMVLLNGASERGAGAALRFFPIGMSVAGVAAATVAGVATSAHARKQKSRLAQAVWGTAAGSVCLGVLGFLLMVISFGIAS